MKDESQYSILLTEKSEAKETSIAFTGTKAVLGIALIAFGFGYAIANSKKGSLISTSD